MTTTEGQPTTGRRTALITGASGGIGEHLARRFAEGGFDLVLVARREDRLRALADGLTHSHGIAVHVLAADLARAEATAEVVAKVRALGIEIDALVNNAGFANQGDFVAIDGQADRDLVQVNVAALTDLTKRLLPGMVARRRGWVLNVASTAAYLPGPYMATYYASKAYVLSFSEALAVEVEGTGVTVSVLCPGPTETGFAARAGLSHSPLFRGGAMDAESVSRSAYRGLLAGKRVIIPGVSNKVGALAGRLAPRGLLARIAARLNTTPG